MMFRLVDEINLFWNYVPVGPVSVVLRRHRVVKADTAPAIKALYSKAPKCSEL